MAIGTLDHGGKTSEGRLARKGDVIQLPGACAEPVENPKRRGGTPPSNVTRRFLLTSKRARRHREQEAAAVREQKEVQRKTHQDLDTSTHMAAMRRQPLSVSFAGLTAHQKFNLLHARAMEVERLLIELRLEFGIPYEGES